jgi:hypothetical protein
MRTRLKKTSFLLQWRTASFLKKVAPLESKQHPFQIPRRREVPSQIEIFHLQLFFFSSSSFPELQPTCSFGAIQPTRAQGCREQAELFDRIFKGQFSSSILSAYQTTTKKDPFLCLSSSYSSPPRNCTSQGCNEDVLGEEDAG